LDCACGHYTQPDASYFTVYRTENRFPLFLTSLVGLIDGPSRYAYAGNNPVRYEDARGEAAAALPIVVGIGDFVTGAFAFLSGLIIGDYLFSNDKDACEKCPPCRTISGKIVPPGTIGYRKLEGKPGKTYHGIEGSHHNIYKANQNPSNCKCFWQAKGAVSPNNLPANSMPIEAFVN